MSPTVDNVSGLVNVALGALPSILALIRDARAKAQPDAPPLMDADVLAALQLAVSSSLAKDADWLAAHPVTPGE